MTDPHEETHYQIALTNRQVLIAFIVLLVCLFIAFFAGARIGRDSAPTVDRQANVDTAQSDADDALQFFSGSPQLSSSDGSDAEAGIQTVKPGKKAGTDSKKKKRAERSSSLPPPEPMTRPAESEARIEPLDRSSQSDISAAAEPAPVVTQEPSAGQAVIQVHAGTDRAQAEALVRRLNNAGYKSFLSPAEIDGQQRYRVRVGPFADRDQARRRATELERELKLDTWIPPTE